MIYKNTNFEIPSKILGIFAHSDDETIGAGGTLIKNQENKGISKIICFGGSDNIRSEELKNAVDTMGIEYEILGFKEEEFDYNKFNKINLIKTEIREFKPDYIITHRANFDYHLNHKTVSEIVQRATQGSQTSRNGWYPKGILYSETHSLHSEFHVAVDITNQFEQLIKSLNCHISQIEKNNGYYLDLVTKKAELRGLQVGSKYAEVFQFEPIQILGSYNRHNFCK